MIPYTLIIITRAGIGFPLHPVAIPDLLPRAAIILPFVWKMRMILKEGANLGEVVVQLSTSYARTTHKHE